MMGRPLEIIEGSAYQIWLASLRDGRLRIAIAARLDRLALGNAGDSAAVGEGVSELRIHLGAGWRIYYIRRGNELIVLLGGGSKRTQRDDIRAALQEARKLKEGGDG